MTLLVHVHFRRSTKGSHSTDCARVRESNQIKNSTFFANKKIFLEEQGKEGFFVNAARISCFHVSLSTIRLTGSCHGQRRRVGLDEEWRLCAEQNHRAE